MLLLMLCTLLVNGSEPYIIPYLSVAMNPRIDFLLLLRDSNSDSEW